MLTSNSFIIWFLKGFVNIKILISMLNCFGSLIKAIMIEQSIEQLFK